MNEKISKNKRKARESALANDISNLCGGDGIPTASQIGERVALRASGSERSESDGTFCIARGSSGSGGSVLMLSAAPPPSSHWKKKKINLATLRNRRQMIRYI
ncbi:hypothetical protein SFRURICE_016361 [Spodoptera frugiperda]|nr:hypothetical protein SFRURICE_016361 [Spodoptera frugiperda]